MGTKRCGASDPQEWNPEERGFCNDVIINKRVMIFLFNFYSYFQLAYYSFHLLSLFNIFYFLFFCVRVSVFWELHKTVVVVSPSFESEGERAEVGKSMGVRISALNIDCKMEKESLHGRQRTGVASA